MRQILGWVLLLLMLVSCNLIDPPSPASLPASPTAPVPTPLVLPSPSPSTSPIVAPAPVDPDRLLQHVRTLSFERSTNRDRERARAYLAQTLAKLGWQTQTQSFAGGVNVVAKRPGTQPSAGTLLVTAHYDTVPNSPGADDNASAIATALEVARLLGSRPTPRALQIVFFDQEEVGLVGSFAFTSNPDNLMGIAGVVNLEMLGYACYTPGCQQYPEGLPIAPPNDRGDFIGIVGDQEHLPLLSAFQAAGRSAPIPVITLPVPFKGVLTPDLLRSDHAPFWAKNIGAVIVGDTANFRNPHYHQPSDTPDTLDRPFFSAAAQVVVDAVARLLEGQTALTSDRTS